MIVSSLHGPLNVELQLVAPQSHSGRRHDICTLRGEVLGQTINCRLMLDTTTGELLLSSPDKFTGFFRLGDLVVNQVAAQMGRAQAELLAGGADAQTH